MVANAYPPLCNTGVEKTKRERFEWMLFSRLIVCI